MRHQATLIQTRQIQTLINKYFLKSLQKRLNSMSNLGPIIDPTVGMFINNFQILNLNILKSNNFLVLKKKQKN